MGEGTSAWLQPKHPEKDDKNSQKMFQPSFSRAQTGPLVLVFSVK